MKTPAGEKRSDKTLFFEAIDLATPEERSAFLVGACGGDAARREKLDGLVANYFRENQFMSLPAVAGGASAPACADEEVGSEIDRYRLLEKLGEGGFGTVYVAEQREPVKRRVALKVIKLGMDTRQVVARFEAERQALAMMDHPNIARVLDAGATRTGRPYFVMELVRGVRITEFCEENNLEAPERLRLFALVCRAIEHAHEKGIIHRDIKPSNILVTLHDGVPVPKVIDFGVAKATQCELTEKTIYTQFHQLIGTPAYMSPEQAEMSGLGVDTRTDIYALGVLLYELLVGKTPFDGGELLQSGLDEMRRTIREKEPVRPSTRLTRELARKKNDPLRKLGAEGIRDLVKALRGDLDWIVMKCLEKDRTRRYATAHELTADIERHLNNEAVIARPPTAGYRLRKSWRRNRAALTMAGVIGAVLIAATAVSSRQAVVATRAQASAVSSKNEAERNLYGANMNLAQQAWAQNDFVQLRKILDEAGSFSGRGLEWRIWQRQLREAFWVFRGHAWDVNCVAFSPDGRRLATGSDDQALKIWDVASGAELLSVQTLAGQIVSLAWAKDGKWLATAGGHYVRGFDTENGREIFTITNERARIGALAISPDDRWIAMGSAEGKVRVMRVLDRQEEMAFSENGKGILSVAFSVDGRFLAAGGVDGAASVYELATRKRVSTLRGHKDWVRSVAFSEDGSRVLTASDDMTAKVWEAATGRELFSMNGHSYYVLGAAFSPNGDRIATASVDWTLKLWQARDGREIATLKGHEGNVSGLAFSSDGTRLASVSKDKTTIVWGLGKDGGKFSIEGKALAFSSDCKSLVVGDGARARILENGVARRLEGHSGEVTAAAFSERGDRVITGSADRTAIIWDVANGSRIATLVMHASDVLCVGFSFDGKVVATGGRDRKVAFWEAESGRALGMIESNAGAIVSVAFSRNGKQIACVSSDRGVVELWEVKSGKKLATLEGHSAGVWAVQFSPDGLRLATGSWDRSARIWDLHAGRELLRLDGHGGILRSVGFSPDGKRLITGSDDETARLWDAETGRELFIAAGPAQRTRISSDGLRIATGGLKEGRIWTAATDADLALWKEQEAAGRARTEVARTKTLAYLKQQQEARFRDPGVIRRWMILAPMPIGSIERENELRPGDGHAWRLVESVDGIIDFNGVIGTQTPNAAAYCYCNVYCERDLAEARILVGSDDQSAVFLNGEKIYEIEQNRGFEADEDVIEGVRLKAGSNPLLFKVLNESSEWKGSLRITDQEGRVVEGISFRF